MHDYKVQWVEVQYSCENTTAFASSCCNVVQGGLVLQTQFWSTYTGLEREGQLLPSGSWTIHGLWPDNCDGSYDQYCDLSRQYDPSPDPSKLPDGTPVPPYKGPGVQTFIEEFGRVDLLEYMNTFWINQGAPNEDFWAHEVRFHRDAFVELVTCLVNPPSSQSTLPARPPSTLLATDQIIRNTWRLSASMRR